MAGRKNRVEAKRGWPAFCLAALLALVASVAHSQTADDLYRQGRFADAAAAYRQQFTEDPRSADALAGLGRSLLALRRPGEAAAVLVRALQMRPSEDAWKQALARAYLDAGNGAAAQDIIDALFAAAPHDPEVLFLLGESMYRSGFYERAAQSLQEALALHPDRPAARSFYAVALAKSGHLSEAEAACKAILANRDAPPDLDVLLTYVQILDEARRLPEARPYAEEAVRRQPDNPIARYWEARLLFEAGQLDSAAKEAEQSVALSPDLPFARNLLIQIYRTMGREQDALRQAEWLRDYNNRQATRGAR